jgi:hypothetical protein
MEIFNGSIPGPTIQKFVASNWKRWVDQGTYYWITGVGIQNNNNITLYVEDPNLPDLVRIPRSIRNGNNVYQIELKENPHFHEY